MVVQRLRLVVGLVALAELVIFLLVAAWIGVGWTILATLLTGALGWILLARQGTKALTDLRERARSRQAPGRELGDAGLVALGGLLMVLPGFLTDLVGLLLLRAGDPAPAPRPAEPDGDLPAARGAPGTGAGAQRPDGPRRRRHADDPAAGHRGRGRAGRRTGPRPGDRRVGRRRARPTPDDTA